MKGFNDPVKQIEVKDFIRKENVRVFGLVETKIKKEKFDDVFGRNFVNWNKISNHHWSPLGRVCVCWDPNFCVVKSIESSDLFILCEVFLLDENRSILVCFVYANNRHVHRKKLWSDLKVIFDSSKNSPCWYWEILMLLDINMKK